MYVIVDIETTGGNKNNGRVTEIAAFKHDGAKVIDSFQTLVNPKMPIPPFVQNLTGISDKMVSEAPLFEEIADEFDQFTANAIFVAHNVNFDYRFLREEFRRIGRDFTRKKMCTVQLSRKAFPGLPSYSLGKITKELSITLNGHHRAAVDAEATARLFEKIIQKESQKDLFDLNYGKPDFTLIASPLIDEELIDSIPDESGVFYFYDHKDRLLYVKRSQHILTDICKKLSESDSESGKSLLKSLYRIDWNILGSDLLSQLEEAHEVVHKNPEFNSGKFSMKPRFAAYFEVTEAHIKLRLEKIRPRLKADVFFSSFHEGLQYFKDRSQEVGISLDFVKNGKYQTPTLMVDVHKGEQLFPQDEFYVFDEGRVAQEESFILVKGTHVIGYGFSNTLTGDTRISEDELIRTFKPLPHLELVMRTFLQKGRYQRVVNAR